MNSALVHQAHFSQIQWPGFLTQGGSKPGTCSELLWPFYPEEYKLHGGSQKGLYYVWGEVHEIFACFFTYYWSCILCIYTYWATQRQQGRVLIRLWYSQHKYTRGWVWPSIFLWWECQMCTSRRSCFYENVTTNIYLGCQLWHLWGSHKGNAVPDCIGLSYEAVSMNQVAMLGMKRARFCVWKPTNSKGWKRPFLAVNLGGTVWPALPRPQQIIMRRNHLLALSAWKTKQYKNITYKINFVQHH